MGIDLMWGIWDRDLGRERGCMCMLVLWRKPLSAVCSQTAGVNNLQVRRVLVLQGYPYAAVVGTIAREKDKRAEERDRRDDEGDLAKAERPAAQDFSSRAPGRGRRTGGERRGFQELSVKRHPGAQTSKMGCWRRSGSHRGGSNEQPKCAGGQEESKRA